MSDDKLDMRGLANPFNVGGTSKLACGSPKCDVTRPLLMGAITFPLTLEAHSPNGAGGHRSSRISFCGYKCLHEYTKQVRTFEGDEKDDTPKN